MCFRLRMGIKAKKLRREGYITGVLYGREINPSIPLQMDRKETEKSFRGCMRGTQILLNVDIKKGCGKILFFTAFFNAGRKYLVFFGYKGVFNCVLIFFL